MQLVEHEDLLKSLASIVGVDKTVDASTKTDQALLLSHPGHPSHALFKEAAHGLEQLGPQTGFKSRQELENAAASLALESRTQGMKQIDHVVQSNNGAALFAVQGRLDDPAHHRVHLYKADAIAQTVQQSSMQFEQLQNQSQQMFQAPEQTHCIGRRM